MAELNNFSAINFNPTPVNFQPAQHQSTSVNGGSGVAGVVTAGLGMLNSYFDRKQERELAEQQRNWNEQMMNTQNEFSLDMWNKTNEYNSPSKQVERLREAGLNPLYYGLDGTSANSFESAQAMGYDRASMRGLANPIQQGLDNILAVKSLQKDIELKNAQIDKTKADTSSVGLDNEWKDKTMDARVEAQTLANNATKEQIELVKTNKRKAEEEIKKVIAETDNELAKKLLIEAQTNVAKASEKEILEMLPYKKLLTEAQTQAQKAAAAASFVKAAIDRKLLNEGYFDQQIKLMSENAKNAEYQAALNGFKLSVKTGNIFGLESDANGNGKVDYGEGRGWNEFMNAIGIFAEALVGPFAGILK